MTFGKYLLRWVKYLVKMILLVGVLMIFMIWSETSTLTFENFTAGFFGSLKGQLFIAAVLIWSLAYPVVEYVERHADYDMEADRKGIAGAFAAGGMKLAEETDGRMVFRGETAMRRVLRLGEDAVTLTRDTQGGFAMEGPRRFVTDALTRIPAYVEKAKQDQENQEI